MYEQVAHDHVQCQYYQYQDQHAEATTSHVHAAKVRHPLIDHRDLTLHHHQHVPVPGDPARQVAASVRVHVGSLLTRETAPSAPPYDGTSPTLGSRIRIEVRISVRTLILDTRPDDVFHG